MTATELLEAADELCRALEPLTFGAPVTHVYNPLVYARNSYRAYLQRYGQGSREVVFLGMNPGPWGMAQTGVPFGDPELVRDWLGIDEPVSRPDPEHPKRPVLGCASPRKEVSGQRLWGAARERYGDPEKFFSRFFVANYCPLCFMEASGRNRTPDKLPAAERGPLEQACDAHLRRVIAVLSPRLAVGVGAFAAKRLQRVLAGQPVQVGQVLHPSPASPAANRDWAGKVTRQLQELGACG
jgi:single-strand selective monofunctional uracil DNA glycosylase